MPSVITTAETTAAARTTAATMTAAITEQPYPYRCRRRRVGRATLTAAVVVVVAVATLALALGVSGGVATAATWHVAADGSGDFPSIQETIEQARDGDTILIQAGRYTEDVTVHSKARLRIIGEGPARVFIEGLNRVGTLHVGKWPYGATDVEISGMTIQQHGGLGVGMFNGDGVTLKNLHVNGMVFVQQVSNAHIVDCTVGGSETTGLAFADSHVRLTGNVIHNNDYGVTVGGDSVAHLERNVITRNLFEAVRVTDGARATLLRNTLARNGGGVAFHDEAAGRVEGNIIVGGGVGIAWSAAHPVTIAHNGLHHNVSPYQVDGAPLSAVAAAAGVDRTAFADVYASPNFVAPERGDYRLAHDSPMLRIGGYPYLGALPPAKQ